jgi:hypothetical protein
LDWNFAALMAMVYNCSDFVKKIKSPVDFLMRFDSEVERDNGRDTLADALQLFATEHNARLKGG